LSVTKWSALTKDHAKDVLVANPLGNVPTALAVFFKKLLEFIKTLLPAKSPIFVYIGKFA
jgi:hypothetical protein